MKRCLWCGGEVKGWIGECCDVLDIWSLRGWDCRECGMGLEYTNGKASVIRGFVRYMVPVGCMLVGVGKKFKKIGV